MTAPQATSPLLAGTAAMRFTLPRRAALYLQGSIVLSFLAASAYLVGVVASGVVLQWLCLDCGEEE